MVDKNDISSFNIEETNFDILLIPFTKYKEKSFPFELAINTRSFGEMPNSVLVDYFNWIQSNISKSGIFYNTNRYVFTKSKDQNKIRDYPYDNYWNIIISQPQWLQTHLHEFLLSRSSQKVNIPIQFILQSFPISTPPPGPIMTKIQTQDDWLKNQLKK